MQAMDEVAQEHGKALQESVGYPLGAAHLRYA
jgi:hypothetical protein